MQIFQPHTAGAVEGTRAHRIPVRIPEGEYIMHIRKRTYSIDERTLSAFEKAVEAGSRSLVVSDLMKKFVREGEGAKIREAVIKGLQEMNDIYLEESKAWYPLEEEVYEKANRPARTRRHHTSRIRSNTRA